MRITLIDYGAGNLHSVAKAFAHVTGNPDAIHITRDAGDLAAATHIVLPGVGAFADGMAGLEALPGMRAALEREVEKGKPFLGICVGMQMMFARGHEHGLHAGLGWLQGEIVRISPADPACKVPHIGWNDLQLHQPDHPICRNIAPGDHAYFVHSYCATGIAEETLLASADHGQRIVALVAQDNLVGVQFHPEKSQQPGLQLLRNFVEMPTP